jgi:hypothetical protein
LVAVLRSSLFRACEDRASALLPLLGLSVIGLLFVCEIVAATFLVLRLRQRLSARGA